MNAINLYITVPDHHTITLPAELPTGSQAQIIILTENNLSTAQPLDALAHLQRRRAARQHWRDQTELDAQIQANRNDWDD